MSFNNCCTYEKTQTDIDRRLDIKQMFELQDDLNKAIKAGWDSSLSQNHFRTAIISEAGEYLNDHGVGFKWWSLQDPANYDSFGADVEIIDIVHFYLSIMIMHTRAQFNTFTDCPPEAGKEFEQFDGAYIGTDKGNSYHGIGLLVGSNVISYDNFMNIIRDMLETSYDMFLMVDSLDRLVSSVGMISEYVSALYYAKASLNLYRQTAGYIDGSYVKVNDGVEDNDRLKPLVDAFMDDTTMTLAQLKTNVETAFYELAP